MIRWTPVCGPRAALVVGERRPVGLRDREGDHRRLPGGNGRGGTEARQLVGSCGADGDPAGAGGAPAAGGEEHERSRSDETGPRHLEPLPEEEGRVRRHVAAELEHDLRVRAERDRARVAPPAAPVDEGEDGRTRREAHEAGPRQRLPPHLRTAARASGSRRARSRRRRSARACEAGRSSARRARRRPGGAAAARSRSPPGRSRPAGAAKSSRCAPNRGRSALAQRSPRRAPPRGRGGSGRRRRSARGSAPRRPPRRGVRRRARRRAARAGDPGRDALASPQGCGSPGGASSGNRLAAARSSGTMTRMRAQHRVARRRDRPPGRRRAAARRRRPPTRPTTTSPYRGSTRRRLLEGAGLRAPRPGRAALVRMSSQRGRFTLVTFLYTNCPDVCPLIAEHLNTALRRLGERADTRVLAVSVDPKGDTPAAVRQFRRRHTACCLSSVT